MILVSDGWPGDARKYLVDLSKVLRRGHDQAVDYPEEPGLHPRP